MAIEIKENTAVLSGVVTVEEAQSLHEFLLMAEAAEVDLHDAAHLHTAVLQVLAAARPKMSRPFSDEFLLNRVQPAFSDK